MTGAGAIDRLLWLSLAERVAFMRHLLARGDEGSDAYLLAVMRDNLEVIADAHRAFAAQDGGVAAAVDLVDLMKRALRLLEPRLRETCTQIVFETQPDQLTAWGDNALLLRALLALFHAVCAPAPGQGDGLRTLKLSLGSTEGPWLWLSGESLGDAAGIGELAAEVEALVASAHGRAEWVPLPTEGQRALRVSFMAAAPAPAVMPASTSAPPPLKAPEPAVQPAPLASPATRAPPPPPARPEEILGRAHAKAAAAMEAFITAERETSRVLVIDDEEALLALFAAVLPTIGVAFELASSAEAALALLEPGRFNLVIADKNLPGMSGLAFLRKLSEVDPLVGSVLVTGYASAHAISEALGLGVYDFLDKPFPDLPVLLSRLEMALQRQRTHARVVRLARELSEIAAVLPVVTGRLDPRVARVVRLIAPSDAEEDVLRVLVLAPAARVAELRARGQAGVVLEVAADLGTLKTRLLASDRRPDLVLVDPALWPEPLAALVALGKGGGQTAQVVVITDDDALAPALDALSAGVADYLLVKGAEPDLLASRLALVLRRLRLHRRDRALVLELLGVDLDDLTVSGGPLPAAEDLATFEPKLGGRDS